MKVARLAKRRTEAHDALEHGRILKGGMPLKPAYSIKVGDILEIHYSRRVVTVAIRDVPLRATPGVTPSLLYDILQTRTEDPLDP